MSEPTKRFVVSRGKWLRGDPVVSRLRDGRGQMCCLGFCAVQLGTSHDALLDVGEPCDLDPEGSALDHLDGVLLVVDDDGVSRFNSALADRAIDINDANDIDDVQREALLTELFAKHGYTLEFVP